MKILLHVEEYINGPTRGPTNESEKWRSPGLGYTPRPGSESEYDLICIWAVTWPVINDEYENREGTGRRNLEHSEPRKYFSQWM